MEVRVELEEALVDELDEEAALQGFDDREAYLRWIVAHRPMSELASTQAPAVASRVSELEERVKLLERQLDLDQPVDADSDLAGSSGGGSLEAGGGASLDAESGSGGASLGEMDTSTDEMDLDEPEPATEEPEEEAAGDDDIADAIGDIEIEDEEAKAENAAEGDGDGDGEVDDEWA